MSLQAVEFAVKAHAGQKRKGSGEPYVLHPIRVARLVIRDTDYNWVIDAALLHDVLEDTKELIPDGMGAGLVEQLTIPKGMSKIAHMERLIDRGDVDALLIKMADMVDNLTEGLDTLGMSWAKKYIDRATLLLNGAGRRPQLWNTHCFKDLQILVHQISCLKGN